MPETIKFWLYRPSKLLGLLLFAVLALYILAVRWVVYFPEEIWFGVKAPSELGAQHWLASAGVVSAICGWIVAGMITVRNSTKQHTMNLLLESRLSPTYMQYANAINSNFFEPCGTPRMVPIGAYIEGESEDQYRALTFILNYFEFVAVGIRCGDLDERIVKNTYRGIFINLVTISDRIICHQRRDDGKTVGKPKCLEHLLWLDRRWRNKKEDILRFELRGRLRSHELAP